jgi:predicted nucleotidyltransferase
MVSLNSIQDRREDILRIAAKHGASNVRIFGSVVRGQAGEGSDVDVLVHLNDDRSLLDHVALMHDLEDLLGCKVDVVEDDALHRSIRQRVLAEAMPL